MEYVAKTKADREAEKLARQALFALATLSDASEDDEACNREICKMVPVSVQLSIMRKALMVALLPEKLTTEQIAKAKAELESFTEIAEDCKARARKAKEE